MEPQNSATDPDPGCYAARSYSMRPPRAARRSRPIPAGPRTLLVIDEASMMTGPDLADLISLADGRGGKVIVAGDTGQLRAGRNGSCF